jgi:hypothetical protein
MNTAVDTLRPVAVVPKLWPESTIVCLGGGSSLTAEDVAFCRDKARVIAIKEAGCCRIPGHEAPAPWADVLYAAEEKFYRFVNGAREFKGLKYSIQQDRFERPENRRPPTEWAQPYPDLNVLLDTGDDGLELEPNGLRTGFNSGYQAINLAVHLGAKKIVLLGYDMWRGPSGDQNWFGAHPTHLQTQFPVFLAKFNTITRPLAMLGIEVVNASRFTMLKAFPMMPLSEALS